MNPQRNRHQSRVNYSVQIQLAPVKNYYASLNFKKYRQMLKIKYFFVSHFKTSKRHMRKKTSAFENNPTIYEHNLPLRFVASAAHQRSNKVKIILGDFVNGKGVIVDFLQRSIPSVKVLVPLQTANT